MHSNKKIDYYFNLKGGKQINSLTYGIGFRSTRCVARLLWSCDVWCWSLADSVDGIKLDDGSFDDDIGRDDSVVGKTPRDKETK